MFSNQQNATAVTCVAAPAREMNSTQVPNRAPEISSPIELGRHGRHGRRHVLFFRILKQSCQQRTFQKELSNTYSIPFLFLFLFIYVCVFAFVLILSFVLLRFFLELFVICIQCLQYYNSLNTHCFGSCGW